jgi:hypothetical protein
VGNVSENDQNEPFLSRWSRMKRGGTRAEEKAAVPAAPAPQASAEAEPLDLDKLPRIEELTAESDIMAFLDKRVPASLRNAALSRMWALDPTIRDFIEVAEYQWDWNVPGGAPFYELIEPGTSAGTAFADATSAIARELGDGSPAKGTAPAADAEKPGCSAQQEIDQAAEARVAVQQPDSVAVQAEPSASDAEMADAQGIAETTAELQPLHDRVGAPQQERRRHGGALPV